MNEKLAIAAIALVAVVMTLSIAAPAMAGSEKVEICHKGETITVSENAVPAHIGHGDTVGACGDVGCPPDCGGGGTAFSVKFSHF